jgi:hypothetical protein
VLERKLFWGLLLVATGFEEVPLRLLLKENGKEGNNI